MVPKLAKEAAPVMVVAASSAARTLAYSDESPGYSGAFARRLRWRPLRFTPLVRSLSLSRKEPQSPSPDRDRSAPARREGASMGSCCGRKQEEGKGENRIDHQDHDA